jgi:hypothetical protein
VQAPREQGRGVGERERDDERQRHDRGRQDEQHRHEDELRRDEVARAGLELEVADDRRGQDEQRQVDGVDLADDARRGKQSGGDEQRDAGHRLRRQLAPIHRLRESRPRRLSEADRFRHSASLSAGLASRPAGRAVWTFVARVVQTSEEPGAVPDTPP